MSGIRKRDRINAKKLLRVPTEEDWGDYQLDLDQNHAHSIFAGRTNQDLQPFFKKNPIELADELRWMPAVPFRYYMLGFRDFVMAQDFDLTDGSDAASCFLGLVLEKLEAHPLDIAPVMPELMPSLEYVSANQLLFDADESIYGRFPEKLARIENLYAPYRQR